MRQSSPSCKQQQPLRVPSCSWEGAGAHTPQGWPAEGRVASAPGSRSAFWELRQGLQCGVPPGAFALGREVQGEERRRDQM